MEGTLRSAACANVPEAYEISPITAISTLNKDRMQMRRSNCYTRQSALRRARMESLAVRYRSKFAFLQSFGSPKDRRIVRAIRLVKRS